MERKREIFLNGDIFPEDFLHAIMFDDGQAYIGIKEVSSDKISVRLSNEDRINLITALGGVAVIK